ncbi:MAG: TRAP transporter large permease subunit [Actinobacteria bacterium]|nr:TRAP transporter large permease subunit [Actinomycetota bacterium]
MCIAAPSLIGVGVSPLAAHFFVFWFDCMSGMTPPVALTSYTAAGLAGAGLNETAFEGLRLAFAGFLIPFFIIFNEQLLLFNINISILSLVLIVVRAIVAIVGGVFVVQGYFSTKVEIHERLIALLCIILLIQPNNYNFLFILPLIVLFVVNINRKNSLELEQV